MKSLRAVALLATFAASTAAPVFASPFKMDFVGTAKGTAVSISGYTSGTFFAGELHWTATTPPAGIPGDLYTYCVDVLHVLTSPEWVDPKSTAGMGGTESRVGDAGSRAAWLFNTYAPGIHSGGTNTEAAALQVAMWEAIYDSTLNLGTGHFVLGTGGAVQAQAQTYLSALSAANDGAGATATWLDTTMATGGATGQDQIYSRAPEPGTMALLGLGILGIGARVARRFRG